MNDSKTILFLVISITSILSAAAQSSPGSPFDTTMFGKNTEVGRYVKTTLVAEKLQDKFQIAVFQNTPAAFHGRPEFSRQLNRRIAEGPERK